ncbi:MAG: hypothetical protein ACP5HC_02205 [Caldisericum sp.]
MKNLVVVLIGGIFVILVSSAFAVESCVKCHKCMDKVADLIEKTGAKSANELVDFLRNKSIRKNIHRVVKDEDIKKAFVETKNTEKCCSL